MRCRGVVRGVGGDGVVWRVKVGGLGVRVHVAVVGCRKVWSAKVIKNSDMALFVRGGCWYDNCLVVVGLGRSESNGTSVGGSLDQMETMYENSLNLSVAKKGTLESTIGDPENNAPQARGHSALASSEVPSV